MATNDVLLLDTIDSSSEAESNDEYDTILAIISNQKENPRYWLSDHIKLRKERGEFRLFNDLSDEKFTNYFRMDRSKFFELHDLIKDDIKKKNTNMRKSISSIERLTVTLRYVHQF